MGRLYDRVAGLLEVAEILMVPSGIRGMDDHLCGTESFAGIERLLHASGDDFLDFPVSRMHDDADIGAVNSQPSLIAVKLFQGSSTMGRQSLSST